MKILIVGATGATGRLLLEQLIDRGHDVKVIVRSTERLPENIKTATNLTIIHASILDLSDTKLGEIMKGCDAIASCLGHTLSWKGIFGHPRRLVTDAVKRLCTAIETTQARPVKFVLMNTIANRNRDLHEHMSFMDKCAIGLIRLLVPPQKDNEEAADFLRVKIGPNNNAIEWVAVRPDALIDEKKVTSYDISPSPTRGIIFNSGKTSRINVGHFMAELITNDITWDKWKGQMPVIYNT